MHVTLMGREKKCWVYRWPDSPITALPAKIQLYVGTVPPALCLKDEIDRAEQT